MTASTEDLESYGLPPRPDPSNAAATARWQLQATSAKQYVSPVGSCGGPGSNEFWDTDNFNWSGHTANNTDFGDVAFTWVTSNWVVPTVSPHSGYTDYKTAPDAPIWDGLGITSLIQAGTDSAATTGTATYHFFFEDYPLNPDYITSLIPSPGDAVSVWVQYEGSDSSYFFLEDLTTGYYTAFDSYTPYVGYNAVNFIQERTAHHFLPSYPDIVATENQFGDDEYDSWSLTTTNDISVMVGSDKCPNSPYTTLAEPTGVNNSDSSFTYQWYAGNPYCG